MPALLSVTLAASAAPAAIAANVRLMTNLHKSPLQVSFPWKKAAPRLRLHRWARGRAPRACRYFFVTFQNTGAGAIMLPSTLLRTGERRVPLAEH